MFHHISKAFEDGAVEITLRRTAAAKRKRSFDFGDDVLADIVVDPAVVACAQEEQQQTKDDVTQSETEPQQHDEEDGDGHDDVRQDIIGNTRIFCLRVGDTVQFQLKGGTKTSVVISRVPADGTRQGMHKQIDFQYNTNDNRKEVWAGKVTQKYKNGYWMVRWEEDGQIAKIKPIQGLCPPIFPDNQMCEGIEFTLTGGQSSPMNIPINTPVSVNSSDVYPLYMFI
jgi:hypothetical protein